MKLYMSNEELRSSICELVDSFANNIDDPYYIALYSFCINKDFELRVVKTDEKDYRGECFFNKIVMFESKYETIESMKWLFLHELGHLFLQQNEVAKSLLILSKRQFYFDKGFGDRNNYYWNADGYYKYYNSDEGHESDPEERIVSDFATWVIGKDYSRKWFRERQKELG